MDWNTLDYLAAALLIGGGAGAYLLMRRLVARPGIRLLAGVAIIGAVALVWVQLAVGIF